MLFQDMGILQKFYEDELNAPMPRPLPKTLDEEATTNLSQISSIFMCYALGIVFGILVFAIEHLKYRMVGKKLQKERTTAASNDEGNLEAWKEQ